MAHTEPSTTTQQFTDVVARFNAERTAISKMVDTLRLWKRHEHMDVDGVLLALTTAERGMERNRKAIAKQLNAAIDAIVEATPREHVKTSLEGVTVTNQARGDEWTITRAEWGMFRPKTKQQNEWRVTMEHRTLFNVEKRLYHWTPRQAVEMANATNQPSDTQIKVGADVFVVRPRGGAFPFTNNHHNTIHTCGKYNTRTLKQAVDGSRVYLCELLDAIVERANLVADMAEIDAVNGERCLDVLTVAHGWMARTLDLLRTFTRTAEKVHADKELENIVNKAHKQEY